MSAAGVGTPKTARDVASRKPYPILLVRFEIGAFAPLVPRVDEHQPVIALVVAARVVEEAPQPDLVVLRRAVVEDVAVVAAPRRVVPAAHQPAIHGQPDAGTLIEAVSR